jgi:type VI secretion system secreted protein VgrG
VGPAGEEIHTDKYGRVVVQFHWDREGAADENSSCWVRVAQRWAGKGWGAVYIPRIGHEVLVDFLEGDPDQPIITGVVYNGANMPPYDLPAEKTKSVLKSNSSKGGGGFNEIRLEDKKGEEQIFIHGEKNIDIRVKNDRFETILNDRHLEVTNNKLEKVGGNRYESVGADHREKIGKDRHLKILGKEAKDIAQSLSLGVTGDVIEQFKANQKTEVTQTCALKAMSVKIEASTGIELKCGGSSIVLTPAAIFIMGGPLVNINSGSGPPVGPVMASLVAPQDPTAPESADSADPGEVAEAKATQRQTRSGKYGSVPVTLHQPEEGKTHWIEIEMVDEDDNPVSGVLYRIKLPDGSVSEGTLDEKGRARVEGFEPGGNCEICFPELDGEAWEKI